MIRSCHAETDGDEVDVETNDNSEENAIRSGLDWYAAVAENPIHNKTKDKDGKVECGIVMMHVRDTGHDDEWQIV